MCIIPGSDSGEHLGEYQQVYIMLSISFAKILGVKSVTYIV
jgi:hypothetical protein